MLYLYCVILSVCLPVITTVAFLWGIVIAIFCGPRSYLTYTLSLYTGPVFRILDKMVSSKGRKRVKNMAT